jgi:hypothetical protein
MVVTLAYLLFGALGTSRAENTLEIKISGYIQKLNHTDPRIVGEAFRDLQTALTADTSGTTLKTVLRFLDPQVKGVSRRVREDLDLLASDALSQWEYYLEAYYEILRGYYEPFQKVVLENLRIYSLATEKELPVELDGFLAAFKKLQQGTALNAREIEIYSAMYRNAERVARKSANNPLTFPIKASRVDDEGKLWFFSSFPNPKRSGSVVPVEVSLASNVAILVVPDRSEPKKRDLWRSRVSISQLRQRAESNHRGINWTGAMKSLNVVTPEVTVKLMATMAFGLPRVELIPAKPEFEAAPVEWHYPSWRGSEAILMQHWGRQSNPKAYSPLVELTEALIQSLGAPADGRLSRQLHQAVVNARARLHPEKIIRLGQVDFNRDANERWDGNLYPEMRAPEADPADLDQKGPSRSRFGEDLIF